ncbi:MULTISPECIES: DUF4239 domain-containing protein [Bradyrhizobium]|jgi:hypothetical protein|nr:MULTISPECIES: DUF4239 domain-containing protein [Bradyrhizobium]MCS3450593.1 hypothetical protein [Bradyrhizobium elkanii]MCS3558262.1 hypothetical protein [Bradyrhizobium elkanii]MCW2151891.1 hypothetical protein [Bradyrhizobium elkanii]MCW2358236.1 hypothetical protein [Bradyrhizobium elkanii]MCW2375622.1 hypothetical protein [Bradyrhizobium elkanii]
MSPIAVSLIALAIIIAAALFGTLLRNTLPGHYLADDSKDYIRLGIGLITTLAALVLGLLVGSANSSYDAQNTQVRHLTANIILLDNLLEQYGPESRDARDTLRGAVEPLIKRIWREDSLESAKGTPFRGTALSVDAYGKIQNLSPKTDAQRSFKERAIQLATDLVQTRLLLFEHADTSIPMPFLAILVFWLAIIFMSFSLFSRLTPINIVAMLVFATSASAALFLILELSQPFVGLMQISSTPLRNALAPLGS